MSDTGDLRLDEFDGVGIERLPPALGAGVRLWRVDLDSHSRVDVRHGLAVDELARADRFVYPEDARRFMAARHALRRVLGVVTGRDPADLAFATQTHGKPVLVDAGTLDFNLSHSAGECVIAMSFEHRVGVDVEVVQPLADVDALARLHFTERERNELSRAGTADRTRAFLVGWTRKEACLKALGVGLVEPPANIDAGCSEEPRDILVVHDDHAAAITLASLRMQFDVVGAVAVAARR